MTKTCRALIVESASHPDLVSIRAIDGTSVRDALAEAGFGPGDVVQITLLEEKVDDEVEKG